MHGLWNFFLERRAFTVFTMVALTIASTYAIISMPKEAAPDVTIPTVIVSVGLPGATASDVERLVVDKMEPTLRNVSNVHKVTSTASQGLAMISVAFNQNVDLNIAVQDVRNAVDRTKGDLPSDATNPVVTKIDTSDQPILTVAVSSPLAPEALTALGDDLKDELESIDGVSKVEVSGVRQRQVSVIVDNDALGRFKLSIGQVIQALRNTNASAPAGTITTDNIRYPVQFNGDLTNVADISAVPIATQKGTLTVGDVAQVINGFEEPTTLSHLYTKNGDLTYALTLNIYKAKGGSILNVSDNVKQKLDSLNDTMLKGSNVAITYDAAKEVRTDIRDLTNAGRDTIILVMLILFISIGFLESVVSALSIPFSFMIAFIGMWLTGNTINFLSLFSLIIAIGILVDSGIVVVEAIHTNREKGMDKMDAAKMAIQQYSWPLIAGTMTTVAVFFPLFFLSGVIGDYMKTIPFTVIVVLLASIVVALGFVPLIALTLLRHEGSKFAVRREQLWHTVAGVYRTNLARLFGSKKAQWAFFGFLAGSFVFAMALPITGLLKVSMFPPSDAEHYYISVELPQASTLADTAATTKQVEDVLSKDPYIDSYTTTIGSPSAFNSFGGSTNDTRLANITVNLVDGRDHKHSSVILAQQMRQELAKLPTNATISVQEDAGGPPSGAPVVVKVWSDDTTTLAQATDQVERIVEANENTRDVTSSLDTDSTQLAISIDRARANEYGLSV
ncbi:MAG TPA: efflux RND transporter permease subunit, partial [Candidatus Paceibacterota bacterium]